jgi:hydrophobe/amphiphile efflux-1 (HAE1) family protein
MTDRPTGGPRRTLSGWSIARPIGTVALACVVVVLGLFYASRLPLDLLPQIVYPQLRVNQNYSGVAPEVLEEQVTKVLETSLATTENLVRLESETAEGRVSLSLHFNYDTDINFALQDASKNLDRARARLPRDADAPTLFKFDPSQSPVYEVAFRSGTRSPVDLRDWVDLRLRPQLLTVPGIASVDVSGGLTREIRVTLDQERLRHYTLTVSDVLNTLRAENQDVAVGNVVSPTFEIVGKTTGKFQTIDDIRSVQFSVPGAGTRIPLSQIATVEDTHREQRLWARLDGVPAVKLSVRKQPDANTVVVAEGVARRIEELARNRFIPGDVEFRALQDQSFFVKNAVRGVRNAALLGATLAMLVVLLFLGSIRKTFVIGLSIPLAVLATFQMMGLGGLTLNIMSLGGLALAVGLLVDSSIVMLENIFRHRERGERDPEEAARTGAAEVTSALFASASTNLAAVVPFLLITGLAALIFREMILTITFGIVASLVTALTIVPMLSAQLAKIRRSSGIDRARPITAFNRSMRRTTERYGRLLEATLRRPRLVMGGAFLVLAVVLFASRGLENVFLPIVDDGGVSVSINLPAGTSAEQTNAVALRVEDVVREMPHVQHVFTTAGGFLFGGSTAERSGRASLDIRLSPAPQRRGMPASRWVAEMQTRLDQIAIPGARIVARPPRLRGLRTNFSGSDVALSIIGDDLAVLDGLGREVTLAMTGIPGLEGLEQSTEEASPELVIALDRQRAADLGLNTAEVGQTVRTALDGTIATRFTDGNNEYDIRVRLPREQFATPEALGAVALFPGRGQPVYLRDVATVTQAAGPTTILRTNQSRQLRITGSVNTGVAPISAVNDEIRFRLRDLALPDGYSVVVGGEEEAIRENQRNLAIVILLAVFLVLVVLAVQYESLTNPLVILVSVPLALVGVGLSLKLTGTPLSAPVLLGVILLAGIVVNNGVLLVQYAELARRRGLDTAAAVAQAGAIRLRPILMTTLTTVLAMLPLALGIGEGTEMMQPLAIVVVGGLTMSTLLTLLVLPSAYVSLHRLTAGLRRWLIGEEGVTTPRAEGARAEVSHPATG